MRKTLGFLLGLLVRLWVATLRVRVVVDPALRLDDAGPIVLGFLHGQQFLVLGARRRRRTVTLISLSRDGELQTGVMRALGIGCARGSSSRAGARGLLGIVRALTTGADAAFAVDGPRGPLGRAKPGAATAAELSSARLVPLAAAGSRVIVLRRTWDRFEIPLPFSRVAISIGGMLDAGAARRRPEALDRALGELRQRAERMLRAEPSVRENGRLRRAGGFSAIFQLLRARTCRARS